MELLVARCAGLDVATDEVVAWVRVPAGSGGRRQEGRTDPTFTAGLEALADWLTAEGVTQVVMVGEELGRPGLELARTAWQAGHSSRVNRPSTWRKGPSVVPQQEQRDPTSVTSAELEFD